MGTKTEAVIQYVTERVENGEYQPRDVIPSEAKLRKHLGGVSRNTVRNGLAELVANGILKPTRGVGYYVLDRKPQLRRATTAGAVRNASCRVWGPSRSYDITTSVEVPPPWVADKLNLGRSDTVLARRRVRIVDGEPFTSADSYYPHHLVVGSRVEQADDVESGVADVFAELGHPWVRHLDQWSVRMPTADERARLKIPAGVPVAEVVRVSFDPTGVPVRVTQFTLPGNRQVTEYEFLMEDPTS